MVAALRAFQWGSSNRTMYKTAITSRVYENLKKHYAKAVSLQHGGRINTDDHNNKISAGRNEWLLTEEGKQWKQNTSKRMAGNTNGKHKTAEGLARCLAAAKKPSPKKHCPHCDRMIAANTFPRWHGDNCKSFSNRL